MNILIRQLWKPEALLFIGLIIADTYLTKRVLALGAEEFNPIASLIGINMVTRVLIALGIVLALYWFQKEKLLWVINLILLAVVIWNLTLNLVLKVV